MDPKEQNEARDRWQNSAPYWEKYRALITQLFAPLTDALVAEARIGPGQSILDIGGGSGEPSLTIAGVVSPGGSVMFSDPAPGMVGAARAEAARRGLTNIQFTQCSGDDLPFATATFDAVIGRFSAMFFAAPVKAIRQTLRVVRPTGRVSFAVWGAEKSNPFLSIVNEVVDRYVDAEEEDPDAPDAFRFAAPGKLAGIFKEAGAANVTEHVLDFSMRASIPFEQFWLMRTEMSDMLRQKLGRLAPDRLSAAKQGVADSARQYFAGDAMNFPARALIVSAGK